MNNGFAWAILIVAGACEIIWAVGLKYSHGFTKLYPSLMTLVSMSASVFLLSLSMKSLPVGTAYAVWTGIGAVGTVLLGIVLFHESASPGRLLCVTLILCGIAGLRFLPES